MNLKKKRKKKIQMTRFLKRNQPEFFYILIGVLASCGMGAVMPVFAVIFGDKQDQTQFIIPAYSWFLYYLPLL